MSELSAIEIHVYILTALAPIIAGGLYAFIKAKLRCLDKIDKRSFRQSQALILLGDKLDDFKKQNHKDGPTPTFRRDIEQILKDEKGNL